MTRGGPGRREPLRGCHELSCFCHAAPRKCHVLSWAHAAASCFSRSSRCLCRSRHALNSGVSGRRSVALPSRSAGGAGGGPLGGYRPLPGFARRFRWRESGPPPGLPRKPRTAIRGLRGRRLQAAASGLRPASPPVRGEGRLRSSVPPFRQRAGRGVPVSRVIARAWVRGRGRAYRGGAARAPDCARETAHAPRPSVPAGGFFAAPSRSPAQKSRKAAPGEPPLSTFILHHTAKCQAHQGT